MKHFLFFIATLFCIQANAQEYKPMLTDGKMWVYSTVADHFFHNFQSNTSIVTVCGDTIVGGKTCKKLYNRVYGEKGTELSKSYYTAEYEENGKIYEWDFPDHPDEFSLIIDLTMKPGDKTTDDILKVTSKNTIEVYGEKRNRLALEAVDNYGLPLVWIEGIGTSFDMYYTPKPLPTGGFTSTYLIECYDNGKLVFTRDDFTKGLITDDVTKTSVSNKSNDKRYDISGRKVTTLRKGEVYIQNGEKHISQ
jgi:hypothetical protein